MAGIFQPGRGILKRGDAGMMVMSQQTNAVTWRVAIALAAILCTAAVPTGPRVGESVPDFRLPDQNGNEKTLASILGPKGALLVFFRSADW